MKVQLVLVTESDLLPALRSGQAAMRVLHRGPMSLLGRTDDEPTEVHQVLIFCPDIVTAKTTEDKLCSKLLFNRDGRRIDKQWRVVLIPSEIACTCGDRPHVEADRSLFFSLRDTLDS